MHIKICEPSSVRNMVEIVGAVSILFSDTAKRNNILLTTIENIDPMSLTKKNKIKNHVYNSIG